MVRNRRHVPLSSIEGPHAWAHLPRWRESAGMTQEQVADLLDTSGVTIHRWESGKSPVTAENFIRLAKLYGVADPGRLMFHSNEDEQVSIVGRAASVAVVPHAAGKRYAYPVEVAEDADGVSVACPDVPEMTTCGGTRGEAMERAADALVTALSIYVDDGRFLPVPSDAGGRPLVAVTALETAKLGLHEAMLENGVSNVELGRKLGLDEKAVRRLRDPLHRSHIGTVETALRALGCRLDVSTGKAG